MTIVNDAYSVVSKWSSIPIDGARVLIYDHNMLIIQATTIEQSGNYPNFKGFNLADPLAAWETQKL